jgi:hypothetical protein
MFIVHDIHFKSTAVLCLRWVWLRLHMVCVKTRVLFQMMLNINYYQASLMCRCAIHVAVLREVVMMILHRFTVGPGVPALTDAYGFALPITPA